MNNQELGFELDWNSEIVNDSDGFVLLPAGDCRFDVVGFERGRHPGSEKLPPCNKAVLQIKLTNDDGLSTTVNHNLFLHTRTEGMLCAFFTAIGQRKRGEKLVMNWNKVVGSSGRCTVGIRDWKSKDGKDMQSNEIKKFHEPDDVAATGKFEPGKF